MGTWDAMSSAGRGPRKLWAASVVVASVAAALAIGAGSANAQDRPRLVHIYDSYSECNLALAILSEQESARNLTYIECVDNGNGRFALWAVYRQI